MIKLIFGIFVLTTMFFRRTPEVKVSGALKNIMMNGDLSAHVNLDTLDKKDLYAIGPVAGLKGEIMVLDGTVFTSAKSGKNLLNQQDKINKASMLVYSHVKEWKAAKIKARINNYSELEKLIETKAKESDSDLEAPFAFKIETLSEKINYHVIEWKSGITHTMGNHKQFSYTGQFINSKTILLGFYSRHHQSIFTHHTTYMHIHVLEDKTKIIGHLDDIQINDEITIYFPER